MKVLSFKATAIEHYRRAQKTQSLVKKKIKEGQWVRGKVARIDQCYGIHIVYMTVEEFDGGFEAERLPPGFYLGPLPAVTIGDPSNQRMEFVVSEDAIRYYPIGRAIRVDSKLDNVGKVEGMIVKTCREPNALKPYWRVTVELPAPELRFDHYAIRDGDTVHLNHESTLVDGRYPNDSNTYIKPSLKSVRFRVPERYIFGFKALYLRSKKVCLRLEDSSMDVSGYVSWMNHAERQVEVTVCNVEQERPGKSAVITQLSESLGIPYDILTADQTKLSYGSLAEEYATFHECDDYMKRTLDAKNFVTPDVFAAGLENVRIEGTRMFGEMSFPINWLETNDMKIYDAVVVKVDDKGTPTEIVKVVAPFLAVGEAAARTAVTVDYATENKIAGKDLTGISVLVRSFQSLG